MVQRQKVRGDSNFDARSAFPKAVQIAKNPLPTHRKTVIIRNSMVIEIKVWKLKKRFKENIQVKPCCCHDEEKGRMSKY